MDSDLQQAIMAIAERAQEHVDQIWMRTSPLAEVDGVLLAELAGREPIQYQWFRDAEITDQPDMQLLLLGLVSGAQAISAWTSEEQHGATKGHGSLASLMSISTGVAMRLAVDLWPVAKDLVSGAIVKKPVYADVQALGRYFTEMHMELGAHYYFTCLPNCANFPEAIKNSVLLYLIAHKHVQGKETKTPMSEILNLTVILAVDYYAAYHPAEPVWINPAWRISDLLTNSEFADWASKLDSYLEGMGSNTRAVHFAVPALAYGYLSRMEPADFIKTGYNKSADPACIVGAPAGSGPAVPFFIDPSR